ncbi:MAG: plasmid pRiA4b ORF-3 family protein [Spirochaetaceae bacterium]|jgi:hypothetical protein|nr:plasmid pRiA4b ORF-3 family protein [Spirochaetaceae bacterium]
MTMIQEDVIYQFLETVITPFGLNDILARITPANSKRNGRLAMEIAALIDSRNIAFRLGENRWISRRGFFEPLRFVISPTRQELLNGILIPGHRCVPFANSDLLPQEYRFYWKGNPVSLTTTEGPPDDFYPYYTVLGEEYAPQYVARDNPENEAAFNSDPFEDPPGVSIQTLDMRNIYRETAFVPGDRFSVRTINWTKGVFELTKVEKDAWAEADLAAWAEAAEAGFEESFKRLGPGICTDEQIAYAYWYGGKRMGELPAYALEEFLYEKTDRIETVAYGIESRFWYAGKEIPDQEVLEGTLAAPDRTVIEDLLYRNGIPISEYVLQAYGRDALYRGDPDINRLIRRIIPPSVAMDEDELAVIVDCVIDILEECGGEYSLFQDQAKGPIRQRVGELHTAVIDLAARLQKDEIDRDWLPKHTFVVLSQIQNHAAGVLEDLDAQDTPTESELENIDNSLDSMIETYEDIKELIDESLDGFRRKNLSVVKPGKTIIFPGNPAAANGFTGGKSASAAGETAKDGETVRDRGSSGSSTGGEGSGGGETWLTLQLGLVGANVWRRIILPGSCSQEELHRVIQILFGWQGDQNHQFTAAAASRSKTPGKQQVLQEAQGLGDLCTRGLGELVYEYGKNWTVKIMFLSPWEAADEETIRCVAGAGAPPPPFVDGPVRFRKFITALEMGKEPEWRLAKEKLGEDYDPDAFDRDECNRLLAGLLIGRKAGASGGFKVFLYNKKIKPV